MSTVSVIIPAAGLSRRMGSAKQLLELGGLPAIVHCISTALAAHPAEVIVILNPLHAAVHRVVAELPVTTVMSSEPTGDMADSLRDGLQAVSNVSTAVLVFPVDYPLVTTQTILQLLAAHRTSPDEIIIPTHMGRRGHPILVPTRAVKELCTLPTLRDVVRRLPGRVAELAVPDEAVLLDMDTPQDYKFMREMFQKTPPN